MEWNLLAAALWRIRLAARSAATVSTQALRARRADFVWRQFAVAVLVELLQRLAGLREFVGVNDVVAIEIQRGNERRCGQARPANIIVRFDA